MNPVLLLPAGLAALAALAVPLLLHLARREDQRPVDFAALRWLAERAHPRRNLRFEEPLLLALRLLLVALLALLLARPILEGDPPDSPWIVAAPGVGVDALHAAPVGSAAAVERRWLAPGFPLADSAPPPGEGLPLASLLRELDMRMPPGAPLVVLVPPLLDGMDAERPRLSRRVDWRVVGAPAGAAGNASEARPPPPRLVFLPDGSGAPYLRAAAEAWRTGTTDGSAGDAGRPIRVWTGAGPLPRAEHERVLAGATVLLAHDAALGDSAIVPVDREDAATLWAGPDGRPLLVATCLGAGRVLQWTRPLDAAEFPALLEPDFPHRLRDALQPPLPPSRVAAADHAPVVADIGPWPAALRDLRPWVAVVIALLFLLERWLATGPRRRGGEPAASSVRDRDTAGRTP